MSRLLTIAAVIALSLTAIAPAHAQQTNNQSGEGLYRAKFGVGAAGVIDSDDETSANFRAELHTNDLWWKLHPFVGVDVNSDGGVWGGLGIAADLDLTNKIVVVPSTSVGLYAEGDSADLGGPVEFRSAIEVAYKMQNAHRIGLELSHISNAGIYDENPGSETISVNYSLPLSF